MDLRFALAALSLGAACSSGPTFEVELQGERLAFGDSTVSSSSANGALSVVFRGALQPPGYYEERAIQLEALLDDASLEARAAPFTIDLTTRFSGEVGSEWAPISSVETGAGHSPVVRQLSLTQFCDCPRTAEPLAQHHAGTLGVREVRDGRAVLSFELIVDGQIPWGASAEGSPARVTAEGEIERR